MTELERAVMDALLDGENAVLVALRDQMPQIEGVSRESTSAGFFTHFSLAPTVKRAPIERIVIAGVGAEIRGLQHGAGFLLFVSDGLINVLEGFTFAEDAWSENCTDFRLTEHPEARANTMAELSRFSQ